MKNVLKSLNNLKYIKGEMEKANEPFKRQLRDKFEKLVFNYIKITKSNKMVFDDVLNMENVNGEDLKYHFEQINKELRVKWVEMNKNDIYFVAEYNGVVIVEEVAYVPMKMIYCFIENNKIKQIVDDIKMEELKNGKRISLMDLNKIIDVMIERRHYGRRTI